MMRKRVVTDAEDERDRYHVREDTDYMSAASAHDCTGLIPGGTAEQGWLDLYHEIYPFGTPQ